MSLIIEIEYEYAEEIDTIVPGDYVIDAVGTWHVIFQSEGKVMQGTFKTILIALKAIEKDMRKNEFFPNIFVQNECGHIDQLVIKMD